MMGIFAKIFGGGGVELIKDVAGIFKTWFPGKMSPEEQAKFNLLLQEHLEAKEAESNRHEEELERQFNERIKEHEGTAADLKEMPILGPIMLFLRGAQRPVWGFGTLYFDALWFLGKFAQMSDQQESTLFAINVLVLGFLFGERAAKNVLPVLGQYFGAAAVKASN